MIHKTYRHSVTIAVSILIFIASIESALALNDVPILRANRIVQVADGCQANGASHPFHFVMGFTRVLQQMNNNNELAQDYVYWDNMRGGTNHPHNPTQAAATALRNNCSPVDGYQVRNAEQEEIYMWMAATIRFMLDETDIGRQVLCTHFARYNADRSVRCVTEVQANTVQDAIHGMLARGYKKLGFTEFEFYKMFKEPNSRNKVEFHRRNPGVGGLQRLNWNNGAAGANRIYWGAANQHVAYRFQDILANNSRAFYQNIYTQWTNTIHILEATSHPF